jgi:hypothetical protein
LVGGVERYAALMAGWMVFCCSEYCHHALAEGYIGISLLDLSFRLVCLVRVD